MARPKFQQQFTFVQKISLDFNLKIKKFSLHNIISISHYDEQ